MFDTKQIFSPNNQKKAHADMHDDMQLIFFSPKILYHNDRLEPYIKQFLELQRENRLTDISGIVPVTMEIDLTNVCSHRCPLCVGRRLPNSKHEQLFAVAGDGESIPTPHAAGYIFQMAAAGVKGLIFTGGGEPTIHQDLEFLIVLSNKLGMKVGLITHGGLLHKHDISSLVSACTWIRVSVDASNEEDFESVHGREKLEWRRVWHNVSKLVEAKQKLYLTGRLDTATLGLAFLAGPHNINGFFDFVRLARDHSVDYAQIRPFYRYVNFNVTKHLLKAKTRFDTDSFKVVGSMQKYSLIKDSKIEPRNYCYCHISQFASVICANEKMYVCCHLRNIEKYCIGDLRNESFIDIMRGKRRSLVNAQVLVKNCQSLCRGDHVNRQVQNLLNGEATSTCDNNLIPKHVDFL